MRILFVTSGAAERKLAIKSEIIQVASGHQLDVVDGLVDRDKVARALGKGQTAPTQYDVVHFGQDGARGVLELDDGALESGELVAMLKKQKRLRFIVLNACDSLATGVTLHNALLIPVVAMNAPMGDEAALRFSEAFYRNLGAEMELHAAVDQAVTTLLHLHPQYASVPMLLNGSRATIDDLAAQLSGCTSSMKADMSALRGDLAQAYETLGGEIADLKSAIGGLEQTVEGFRMISSVHVRRAAVGVLMLLFLLVLLQALTPWLNHVFAG